jgi:hypothetical protein
VKKPSLSIQHGQSFASSWSEIDKTTIERRLRDESECTLTRLLKKKLVEISRTQVWLVRRAKERVTLTRRRRFDISCKTWSICANESYTDNKNRSLDVALEAKTSRDAQWQRSITFESIEHCLRSSRERTRMSICDKKRTYLTRTESLTLEMQSTKILCVDCALSESDVVLS